jgi:DNA-binding response OmpR family regulator
MNIMLARLRSLLRRKETGENPLIEVGNLRINLNSHSVTNKGREIPLSPKEYALLEYLAIHANQAIERITLLEHVWGDNTDLFSNTVDVHIRYLRQKMSDDQNPKIIQTVKNVGYILVRP